MQQWKQENSFFRDPYDESSNFRSRPRKRLKTVTDWKELSQICSGTGQKIKFLLKNRAAVTKTITFLPSILRLDDIEEFSEDRNQPLPTTERPTHKNIRIKNEPSVNQMHVSFAAEVRSSPSGTTSHRPVLVKKERTPQKSILKKSNTKTSITNDNSTIGKKRKRSDQIMEIYTDSFMDDYDISDSAMYAYSYDDINLHNIEPVYNTNVEKVKIKDEPNPTTNNNTMSNNNNTNTNNSDAHKRHDIYSEMSRVPNSLADVILAKDSQPFQADAPTPSPHLSMALNAGIDEQLLSQQVQLIPSQLSTLNQRSSTSLGNMSHISDSISHPSNGTRNVINKRVNLTYVDSQQSLNEHEHISVEESELESQPSTNNKLLQDSYDDDAEELKENLLNLKRKNSSKLLSTKKNTPAVVKKDIEIPLSTQQDDVPATLSYHSNQHKESETQKQVANAYTFVSLTHKSNDSGKDNKTRKITGNKTNKPKDVIELSSGDSNDKKTKKNKKSVMEMDLVFDDSLDDFDVAPRSVKKAQKSTKKTKDVNNNSSGSSSDSNKTIVLGNKKKKNNQKSEKKKNDKQNNNKKKKNNKDVHSSQENQNLKLLISQSSSEDKNSTSQKSNAKSVDLSELEASYAIYMPSSDDFM